MSHFTVLVIGDDHEKQLQPFHEFECTGTDDQYVIDKDVTAECLENADDDDPMGLGWFGLDERTVSDESQIDKSDQHKYGYAIVKDGKLVKAVKRTNPNKTWDWWQVGGRWSGYLKLKPGADGAIGERGLMGSHANDGPGYADQAKKGDIDFAGMRDAAGEKAGALWDKARASLAPDAEWITWEQMRETIHKGDIDAARKAYNEQPAVAAINRSIDTFYNRPDSFLVSREVYVQQARDGAISTYAAVKDSQWFAKGRMGWWACSDDKMTQEEWNRELTAMLDTLPDDTLLTVVDCHI